MFHSCTSWPIYAPLLEVILSFPPTLNKQNVDVKEETRFENNAKQQTPKYFFIFSFSHLNGCWSCLMNLTFFPTILHLASGVFTVSGIIDSFVYHGQKAIKKKMEIGKFSWWLMLLQCYRSFSLLTHQQHLSWKGTKIWIELSLVG